MLLVLMAREMLYNVEWLRRGGDSLRKKIELWGVTEMYNMFYFFFTKSKPILCTN